MLCPYRKAVYAKQYAKEEHEKYSGTQTSEIYAECQGGICPLYAPKLQCGCWRVQKEINEAYHFGKELG